MVNMMNAKDPLLAARGDDPLAGYRLAQEPFYRSARNEIALYEQAYRHRMPLILKGPTGCGKTRFVERMAWALRRPLITLACILLSRKDEV